MNKKKLTGILAVSLAAVVVLGAGATIAKDTAEQITAVYRNIKLVVDGVMVEPKDANGNIVEPFIYDGTTYLPVRAVGQAFEKEVAWDGEANTVYLGGVVEKPAKELGLWNRPYIESSDTTLIKTYQENGVSYLRYQGTRDGQENTSGKKISENSITYPVNTLAKTVKGTFSVTSFVAGEDVEGILKIYNSNGKELYRSPIMRTVTAPVNFEVNIENEIAITFVFEQRAVSDHRLNFIIQEPIIISSDY